MKDNRRHSRSRSLPALLACLPAAALLALAGCGQADPPAPGGVAVRGVPAVRPAGPVQEFTDYTLTETDQGVRAWVLGSQSMRRFADREEVDLVDVHMDFYRAGEHWSVLEADSGKVNQRTRAVHVWGAVDITTDDGRRLETPELFFDNETGRIRNDVANRFTRGTDILTGNGLDATPDLEYVEIKRDVTAEVADPATAPGERP
jgi:LPS export ABC transporter protein LptC